MFKKLFSFTNLKRENNRLKEENARRRDIVSANVHQLRTSLTATKWVLKMLLDGDIGKLKPEEKDYMQKIYERTDRMICLVTSVLESNKSGNLQDTYAFKKSNIVPLIQDTLIDFSGEAFKNEIAITFKKPDGLIPEVMIDPEKIRVVFQNLIENAIKYSDKGSAIEIRATCAGDFVEIAVQDHGIGIGEADQAKIFDRYFRAENAKEKGAIGSGIGLYMTKRIVETHGGTMWFESKKGTGSASSPQAGTTFYFTVPIARK
jgi:signal transduction histidine kinase